MKLSFGAVKQEKEYSTWYQTLVSCCYI